MGESNSSGAGTAEGDAARVEGRRWIVYLMVKVVIKRIAHCGLKVYKEFIGLERSSI